MIDVSNPKMSNFCPVQGRTKFTKTAVITEWSVILIAIFLLPCFVLRAGAVERKTAVLYCTDLFHPHDDPDDHFDLASLYAMGEIDIKGIVLDQGKKQDVKPGGIPVEQLNYLTARNVPWAKGLSEPLSSPQDRATAQPDTYQAGVKLILDILAASEDRSLTIITVGSLRDVAAALNRKPDLFREKVKQLVLFIGEASIYFKEYNVGLDPNAYIRVMNSGLPIMWVPCFDGGVWKNRGNASFWRARHSQLLQGVSEPVMNYFVYALDKMNNEDPIAYLNKKANPEKIKEIANRKRNLWGSAVFSIIADRRIVSKNGTWAVVPASLIEDTSKIIKVFTFKTVPLFVDNQTMVHYAETAQANPVSRFHIVDRKMFPEVMTSATNNLLKELYK